MRIKGDAIHTDVNSIYLSGEVVDFGVSPHKAGIVCRIRLKIKLHTGFCYMDMYGSKRCSETISLVCQIGNIVYVEGSFKNVCVGQNTVKPFILVTNCVLLRRKNAVKAPSTSVIAVLDMLNPLQEEEEHESPKRKKTKSNRTAPVQEL